MLLDTLLAKATGMPGLELWRGLAPRRFLIDHLLADFIHATEILPADNANGLFAVITTSPLGLPQTLPEEWEEVERLGEYFATFRVPAGTTARGAVEALALELIPLFYPSEVFEGKLIAWLQKKLGDDPDTVSPTAPQGGPGPAPFGPVRVIDIPSPHDYHKEPKSEAEQDLDFLYGNGSTPPEYHGYNRDRLWQPRSECAGQLAPAYGPPEASDQDIQAMEEQAFYFG
ncbi:hypothetical protein FUA23_11370 [Neolewinella aurantiaca]|uniref:Uncharacterized protein n=1 Tax=Neolewinella aurantiaca TaxID=2602767 RepID=A0A5C7FSC5_9BACT|nr:hypothetical protein [Neolewinella aurantiaca]TXF89337.1 hypothetical protein FUA23_11370 [Neolewinella aurantiaca]